jgi:hypothetical protein
MGNSTYVVEWNGSESRLPDAVRVCELLKRVTAADAAELSVRLDYGPRRRNLLERLFGMSDRHIEPCFWLAKAGPVAALTFLDEAWSEYRATDPERPVQATEAQRMALSCGELTPAPPEVCLEASRAFKAATEYLQRGERPDWLSYRYVR